MANTKYVTVATVQERFNLINYTPELNLEDIHVTVADVNRPALQLHGFYEHFEPKRIQVIGNVEVAYIAKKKRQRVLESFSLMIFHVLFSAVVRSQEMFYLRKQLRLTFQFLEQSELHLSLCQL